MFPVTDFNKVNMARIKNNGKNITPDIVISLKNSKPIKTVVMDCTITADVNNLGSFKAKEYYEKVVTDRLGEKYGMSPEAVFMALVLDWRGAWATRSHKMMLEFGIPSWMLEIISMEVLQGSHEVWRQWNEKFRGLAN